MMDDLKNALEGLRKKEKSLSQISIISILLTGAMTFIMIDEIFKYAFAQGVRKAAEATIKALEKPEE